MDLYSFILGVVCIIIVAELYHHFFRKNSCHVHMKETAEKDKTKKSVEGNQTNDKEQPPPYEEKEAPNKDKTLNKPPFGKRTKKKFQIDLSNLDRKSDNEIILPPKKLSGEDVFITMIIDRSGSMKKMGNEVSSGVNTYLDEQRKFKDQKTYLLFSRFDAQYELL